VPALGRHWTLGVDGTVQQQIAYEFNTGEAVAGDDRLM